MGSHSSIECKTIFHMAAIVRVRAALANNATIQAGTDVIQNGTSLLVLLIGRNRSHLGREQDSGVT